jgi:polar amino acid transport system substrate-binding protein
MTRKSNPTNTARRRWWHGGRVTVAGLVVTIAALTVSACSSSGGSSGSSGGASASVGGSAVAGASSAAGSGAASGSSASLAKDAALYNALPAKYKQNGLRAAVFNDWPPDEFVKDGTLQGWSVDLAKDLSILLGVKFSYTPTSFDAVLPGIQNGRFDAGFASFAPTPDRLKVLDFVPERSDGTAYASLKSNNIVITGLADICGHSAAVLTGAFDYQYLTKANETTCKPQGKPAIQLKQFTTQSAAQLAMTSGRVQLVAAGSATLGYLAKQDPKVTVSTFVANPLYNCIGVRKGDPLGQTLADGMQKLIDMGVYKQVMDKWGVGNLYPVTKGMLITEANPTGK